ncbi:MAG: hypothetical protein GY834_03530 [Bacteroidetes bacterium]|nr:hypothetical protein [Bacteroidota bacterium]
MEYDVAFEISSVGLGNLTFIFPGILFMIIGALMIKFKDKLSENRPEWFVNIFSKFFFGFAVFWTLTAGLSIGFDQSSIQNDYEEEKYSIIEGVVENFDPMPSSGHKMESFTVKGIKFEYSDFIVRPGFRNTTSHGGPIQEGLPVRISYIGNIIVKLEVGSANKRLQPDLRQLRRAFFFDF